MLLKELSQAVGVSGDEGPVRKVVLDAIREHVADLRIDPLGGLTALKKRGGRSKKQRPRVMLAAHMDEVGLMITGIENNGLLRFTSVGGLDDRILPGLRVRIGEKQIPGVIIWAPIHYNKDQNVVRMSSLRIDIGASDKNGLNGQVKRGDRAAFESAYMEVGPKMLRGKAFDDRAGCSLLVDVLRGGPYPVDLLAAFTVQEELGLRGARVAARLLQPDVALVLEGSPAFDVPDPLADADETLVPNPGCRLGQGPVLTVMDRSMITHAGLLRFVRRLAEKQGIPYQLKTALGGGTDAGAIHLTDAGIPSAVFSVPCRYIHGPAAYLNRDDYDNTLRLVQAVLHEMNFDALKPL